jgi:hypothetical protein
MAFRLRPISSFPATEGKCYPDVFSTASNYFWIEGLGVIASLDADAELHYIWHVPSVLPSGTAKLEIIGQSYDAGGDAKINPKWKSIAFDETMDIAAGSLNAEGTTTMSWTYGSDAHEMKRDKVTLDADTVAADEFILMRLTMETANWTLNQRSLWLPSILWE